MPRAEGIGVTTVTIAWEEVPKHQRHGFIRSYTVFYQAEGGEALGERAPAARNRAPEGPPPPVPGSWAPRRVWNRVRGWVGSCGSVGTRVNPVAVRLGRGTPGSSWPDSRRARQSQTMACWASCSRTPSCPPVGPRGH